jgi:hypothetical protein
MMAPWPGFEPGSSGRQPLILDRTILPGLSDRPRAPMGIEKMFSLLSFLGCFLLFLVGGVFLVWFS